MKTSMPFATAWSCSVRIISRPVRSPTWARRAYLCPPKSRWRIRPSFVRSKSAPHSSSSRTRSGASCACSCAMRQLFRSFPPRMVSRKCTFQLSSGHTLPSAAAMPPSAITVWAFPRSDLHTIAVFAPSAWASIAARKPAPPAPITTTSYSWRSRSINLSPSARRHAQGWLSRSSRTLAALADRGPCPLAHSSLGSSSPPLEDDPRIRQDAHRQQTDVEVGGCDDDEARPRPACVAGVQGVGPAPEPEAERLSVERVEVSADEIAERVTAERIAREERHVREHEDRAETDAQV